MCENECSVSHRQSQNDACNMFYCFACYYYSLVLLLLTICFSHKHTPKNLLLYMCFRIYVNFMAAFCRFVVAIVSLSSVAFLAFYMIVWLAFWSIFRLIVIINLFLRVYVTKSLNHSQNDLRRPTPDHPLDLDIFNTIVVF